MEILATKLFAKDLVLLLAFHLAERISSLLRQVLDLFFAAQPNDRLSLVGHLDPSQ